ncbi:MAG: alpha/beta hydrolase [Henriciella sp.]|uniref:alpha/beta hydrolase n=1 Tax=Henriciella sp. TaxID=1968823 RepID=UPI0032EFBA6B
MLRQIGQYAARFMTRHSTALVLAMATSACATAYPVAPPPNSSERPDEQAASASLLTSDALPNMYFVTDRQRVTDGSRFGSERSNTMTFGRVSVTVSGMTPDTYASYMLGNQKSSSLPQYTLGKLDDISEFPATPLPFSLVGGVIERNRQAISNYRDASASFRQALSAEFEGRNSGRVVLYVHGFNNSFETGTYNLLELWAASGFGSVPIMFSWPTQQSSVLNYFEDTQDGAFSVYHLKETFRLIASTPGLKSVTVVAHSHGASIATSALRELLIEARGSGLSMYDTYQIETLILAAPDIDLGVMEQRLVAEMFGVGFGQINVYMNPDDNALGLAGVVFGNRRFGKTSPENLSPESRKVFQGVKTVHFILVDDARGNERHNYFRMHPGVLADIGMTLRTDARPADPERPLEHLDLNFWHLDRTYRPIYRNPTGSPVSDGDRD